MKQQHRMLAGLLSCVMLLTSGAYLPAAVPASAAEDAGIQTFPLSDVTVTDPYTVNAYEKEIAYLLSFDSDRLLAGFRENAGLPANGAARYGGWENSLLAGHTAGHYMSAISQAYGHSLTTDEQKAQLLNMMKSLTDGLQVCQQNSKGKPGFIWGGSIINEYNVEQQFDNVEEGKLNMFTESWAPWYTMHKLIAGLVDVYKATGYEPAREVASGLGDWAYNRASGWSPELHEKVLDVEYGGMNDCLYDLYDITGNEKYAVAAHLFDQTKFHERVLSHEPNCLNWQHSNTTTPKFIGALKRYMVLDGKTINGETVDASRYLQYAEAFWDTVTSHHTYITGGNSDWEHFGLDDHLDDQRTGKNCESCISYNMEKLSRSLFTITGDPKYMDYYENTYYNAILASQNPETGMTTYFNPMGTGYFKEFSSEYNDFWCCTCTGMESFSKLGDTIYMHKDNTLYVNIYQSSVLNWKDQNVTIAQQSDFPASDTAVFTVTGSGNLEFRFREPSWRADDLKITVNGTKYSYQTVQGYAVVSGVFKTGDKIRVTIPEEVKAYGLPDNPNVYGFKYGPCVLSAELGTENMVAGAEPVSPSQKINLKSSGGTVKSFMYHINDYLVKEPDAMRFRLTGTDADLTFTLHYQQYQQRYGIYWYFYSADDATDEELPRAKTVITDSVQAGYGQYESDELHAMDESDSVAVPFGSPYRYAKSGGHFTYRMAVDPDAPLSILQVTFRKDDNGKPICITAGDRILFADKLNYSGDSDTYELKYIIPKEVIDANVRTVQANDREYDVIDIGFSAGDAEDSAKVCDFLYMTAVKPYYEYDSNVAYFVDCGDAVTSTVSAGDRFGLFNSLTEQMYGADAVTGMVWGIADETDHEHTGDPIYTANTWPDESTIDNRDKTASFRYTRGQYENNMDRLIEYDFTLPNGTYQLEIGFANPWDCSTAPSVTLENGGISTKLIENLDLSASKTATAPFTVTDSGVKLKLTSEDKAINVTYIKITFTEQEPLPAAGTPGDVNLDGTVDVSDAVLLARFAAEDASAVITQRGLALADVNGDGQRNQDDVIAILKIIAKIA
ncbi:MAG: glycoside hydrolase family 127 protein [Oscillospiraceae bacterium]|nr:glycoside hydrolase family 127 protein [Oscillospiraceae bacterium]